MSNALQNANALRGVKRRPFLDSSDLNPATSRGAYWILSNSTISSTSNYSQIPFGSVVSNALGAGQVAIGFATQAINAVAAQNVWGAYIEVQHEAAATYASYAIEIDAKNKGADRTDSPYLSATGTYGIWAAAGGDNAYGGNSANPSNTAIKILANSNTWNRGIVFDKAGLTGCDGTTGTAVAIEFAKGHQLQWDVPGGQKAFVIRSDNASVGTDVALVATSNALSSVGTNGVAILNQTHTASAVNSVNLSNSATGGFPILSISGTDANVGMYFASKGAAAFRFTQQNTSNDEFRIGGVNNLSVNYLHAWGTPTGAGFAYLQAKGTDANVEAVVQGKGTGGGRIVDGAGATKFQASTNGIGFFGASIVTQSTGWGTPTGASITTNFPGATATLAQTSQTLAALLSYLKSRGDLGA